MESPVQRASPSESATFEALFKSHYTALHDFIRRYVHSSDIAADLAQETFLDAWARWETRLASLPPNEIKLYLYVAARNRAMNHLAHARVERRYAELRGAEESATGTQVAPDGDPDESLTTGAIERAARAAIEQMPERMRLVYTLSRRDGLSYPEIAQVLGVSVNTVKTQMGRALGILRQAVGPLLGVAVLFQAH